ncbi:NAD(P)/FAD-dependent oxidoreductase, partial [Spirochaetota bacterium]
MCGCGIIGLTIALELLKRGHRDITIIEKEDEIGLHASGRNSGILHAGIYYSPDSLKAKSCITGNRLMKEYCKEKGLPLLETGKVIVTKDESEIDTLHELYKRARANGSPVKLIDEHELSEIEPNAKTIKEALFSPETAIIDPKSILKSMYNDCLSSKVNILTGRKFTGISDDNVAITSKEKIGFNTFINASGAYSDRVAGIFSVGSEFRLIPFKGTYRKLTEEKSGHVRGNIYPVPNIKNPFLGVHFSRGISGEVFIGPTAIPALGRENYGFVKGLDREAFPILFKDGALFFLNSAFRQIALMEPRKYFKRYF